MTTSTTAERLAALAALLAPERAARILTLLAPPAGAVAAERVARWTALSRRDRLSAVSRVLAGTTPGPFPPGETAPQALAARMFRDASALRSARATRAESPGDRLAAPWHAG